MSFTNTNTKRKN